MINPKVLRKERSPKRATCGSFLRLAAHLAPRGKKATSPGTTNREHSSTAAISSFPAKDYQDHNTTGHRANGPHLAVQTQREPIPGEQRDAPPTPKDYKTQQATRAPAPPRTRRAGKPGRAAGLHAQEPPRGKMAAPGAEAEVRGC